MSRASTVGFFSDLAAAMRCSSDGSSGDRGLVVNHAEYEDNILEYDAQKRNKESESESATSKFVESESTTGKISFISSVSQISGSASYESKSLTIKSLEMEKVAMRRNLDNVIKLAIK
ncbi:hypothetical protein COCNU_07G008760 [Cocos nucifera]|uniref:Uncharacterized protein n=1 Tax=Cocos nucifera TaxID=13894 RepID=A0A8K0IFY7_COCNU|nr:hypothetical protein COCNU_07G008760 [Cocos nucifera]